MKNFGGQTRCIMGDVQTVVSPLLCKPQGIFKDKKERKGLLIYKAVPSESNTSAKFIETLSKYQDLEVEVNRMWETNENNYAVEPMLKQPTLHNGHLSTTPSFLVDSQHWLLFKPVDNDHLSDLV